MQDCRQCGANCINKVGTSLYTDNQTLDVSSIKKNSMVVEGDKMDEGHKFHLAKIYA